MSSFVATYTAVHCHGAMAGRQSAVVFLSQPHPHTETTAAASCLPGAKVQYEMLLTFSFSAEEEEAYLCEHNNPKTINLKRKLGSWI